MLFRSPGELGRPSKLFAPLRTPWGLVGVSLVAGSAIVGGLAVVARRSRRRTVKA